VIAAALTGVLATGACTSTTAGAGAPSHAKSGSSHRSRPARSGSSIPVDHRSHRTVTGHKAHPVRGAGAGAAAGGGSHKRSSGPRRKAAHSPAPRTGIAAITGTLSYGATGASVTALQQRLTALGYWIGPADGYYGDSTQQAIFALQKAAGISRDGVFGPQTRKALEKGIVPRPRPSKGYVVQVNLADDLLMVTTNGRIDYVLNTSTGGGYTYYDQGVTSVAITPVGVFHIYSEIDGLVTDSLGQLWRPKYFYSGFAIHGDGYVPPVPVSHGCVRVSNEAIDWIWDSNIVPMGTEVWVYS
jgi:peptidoglycan hydrolase-like protein with peptidoglycan-binding domain